MVIMNKIKELIQRIGSLSEQPSIKKVEAELAAGLGEYAAKVEVLSVSRALIGRGKFFVFHVPDSKQLLVWSASLMKVIDLAKIIPPATIRKMPSCYAPMLEIYEHQRATNWLGSKSSVPAIEKLITGNFNSLDSEMLADLFAHTHAISGEVAGAVMASILAETVSWHYQEAIL